MAIDAEVQIIANRVLAGGFFSGEICSDTRPLLSNAKIAFDGRRLSAFLADDNWSALASSAVAARRYNVAIFSAIPGPFAFRLLFMAGRDPIVGARWVFAEVDLHPIDRDRYSWRLAAVCRNRHRLNPSV